MSSFTLSVTNWQERQYRAIFQATLLPVAFIFHAEAVTRAVAICFLMIGRVLAMINEKHLETQKTACVVAYGKSWQSFWHFFFPEHRLPLPEKNIVLPLPLPEETPRATIPLEEPSQQKAALPPTHRETPPTILREVEPEFEGPTIELPFNSEEEDKDEEIGVAPFRPLSPVSTSGSDQEEYVKVETSRPDSPVSISSGSDDRNTTIYNQEEKSNLDTCIHDNYLSEQQEPLSGSSTDGWTLVDLSSSESCEKKK